MSTRYSQVTNRKATDGTPAAAALPLIEAQTFLIEGVEQLIRWDDVDHDQVDSLLADAMRRIAKTRAAVLDMKRAKLGHTTIASVG